jgi:carbon monoxide dehydrogenase subunit G
MVIEREIEIARPVEEVFAFVSDPRNDPQWCPKVKSVEGSGDRYEVVHKPVPGRPERRMEMRRMSADPPRRIAWTQEDGHDSFRVTYELEAAGDGTRLRQRSEAEVGVPRWLHPLWRRGIGRDVKRQLAALKKLLESPGAISGHYDR